jgi:hypothetical protein
MKLIYFLIIVIIIYFFVIQITVVHIDTIPDKQRNELNKRSELKSMLLSNHIKCVPNQTTLSDDKLVGYNNKYSSEEFQSTNYKNNYYDLSGGYLRLPKMDELYILIRSEYVDDQYRFNIPNQPVTTRYPNKYSFAIDKKFLKHVRDDIEGWNELFYKYYQTNEQYIKVVSLKPVYIMETQNEFVTTVNSCISYINKNMYYKLTYYGIIDRNDDFLNGLSDQYTLQLLNIIPISKSEFEVIVTDNDDGPYMTMNEQLQYVDRMNRLHKDEML